jgi:pathogenesis-related protein 1
MKKALYIIMALSFSSFTNCTDEGDSKSAELDQEQIASLVSRHNIYRSEVGVDDIEWSEDLAKSAQNWANQLGKNCDFEHSSNEYGENIWMGTTASFSPNDVVDSWGSEKDDYNHANNSCSGVCGHYTQIVWASTQYVGCGMVTCDGFDIWVCQYNPPGNYVGEKPYY